MSWQTSRAITSAPSVASRTAWLRPCPRAAPVMSGGPAVEPRRMASSSSSCRSCTGLAYPNAELAERSRRRDLAGGRGRRRACTSVQRGCFYRPEAPCSTGYRRTNDDQVRGPRNRRRVVNYESRYDHWIGGEYVPPAKGQYFENPTPVNGQDLHRGRPRHRRGRRARPGRRARRGAAPGAAPPSAERANILNKIADRMEENLEKLAVAETWENGKPVRETLAADIPLAIDHFRYFAGAIRAQEGSLSRARRRHRRLPLPRAARRGRRRSSRGTSRS